MELLQRAPLLLNVRISFHFSIFVVSDLSTVAAHGHLLFFLGLEYFVSLQYDVPQCFFPISPLCPYQQLFEHVQGTVFSALFSDVGVV
jgi:hypothetical protein